MKQRIEKATIALNELRKTLDINFYPNYHLAPFAGWLNDPNGLIYHNGTYHAFYQHHPFSENWGPMHWGHATSSDMVHWQHQPIALAPGDDYDRDGCFSGSAVSHDGKLYLFYTGHIWLKKEHDDSAIYQAQCLAISEDGIHFEKKGVVIPSPKEYMHFRDPKVWFQDGRWWMIVGARDKNDLGQVLLFNTEDLLNWSSDYQVIAKTDDNNVYMWECPDFFPLGDKFITLFSPQGKKPENYQFRNMFQSGYIIGQWAPGQPYTIEQSFQEIDHGHDFYAPQTFEAADGRRIAIAWMDMWESSMPSKADNWAGCFTVPRELTLTKENKVIMTPVVELNSLRQEHQSVSSIELSKNTAQLLKDNCESCEVELLWDLKDNTTEKFGFWLGQGLQFYIDGQSHRLILERHYPDNVISDYRSAELPATDKLKIRAYIDRSSIEIFINDGELTFSSRIYPKKDQRALKIFAINGPAKLESGNIWELAGSIKLPS